MATSTYTTGLPRARTSVRGWLVLLVVLFVASLPAVTARIYASDEVEYFAFLRSLWFDHDVSFDNEYRYFYESGATPTQGFYDTFLGEASLTPTGHHVTFATIGSALLWSPFYAAADAGVRVARLAGSTVPADGYSKPYLAAVAYGSALYGFLAVLLTWHAARLVVASSGDRLLASLAVWIGTPLLFYMYVAPPFSHAASAFMVAAFLVAWLHVRRRWSVAGMIGLGVLAAAMAMVREQDAFVAAGPALDFAWALWSRTRERAGREAGRMVAAAAVGCVGAAIAYLPQALAYVAINGHLGPSRLVARKMTWTSPHAAQVLMSPEHGLFFWTPMAAVGIAGLVLLAVRAWRVEHGEDRTHEDRRRLAVCLVVIVALQAYVAGAVESWTVAGAFGQRRFVGMTLPFGVGLTAVLALARGGASRKVAMTAIAVAAWWNIALMMQFGTGLMSREKLTLGTNAWNAFVVVPRELPGIAFRYVVDRRSFYAKPRP